MTPLDAERMLSELLAIRADIAELRREQLPRKALNRRSFATAIGVSLSKLEKLIKAKKIHPSAEDPHLIAMSEADRYLAPKTKRERKPAVGHRARARHVDGQSDEALALATKALRKRGAP